MVGFRRGLLWEPGRSSWWGARVRVWVIMQALVRLARRTSLQRALPSHPQGFVTRAAAAQSEPGGGSVDAGVDGAQGGVVGDAPASGVAAAIGNMSSSTYLPLSLWLFL